MSIASSRPPTRRPSGETFPGPPHQSGGSQVTCPGTGPAKVGSKSEPRSDGRARLAHHPAQGGSSTGEQAWYKEMPSVQSSQSWREQNCHDPFMVWAVPAPQAWLAWCIRTCCSSCLLGRIPVFAETRKLQTTFPRCSCSWRSECKSGMYAN